MSNRYVEGATPEWSIDVYWSPRTKSWLLRATDSAGRPIGREHAETATSLTRAEVAVLLRKMRQEIESFLPF